MKHFLFETGQWLGTGQVTFSISPDLLYFRTKWSCVQPDDECFQCTQTVEVIGGDRMVNVFTVKHQDNRAFEIVLQNELLGIFSGTGVIEDELVAWEFRRSGALEGFEVYEKVQEDEYAMHAEYLSSDGARTMIRGKIWKARQKDALTEEGSQTDALEEQFQEVEFQEGELKEQFEQQEQREREYDDIQENDE